jgi:hypothetical protein
MVDAVGGVVQVTLSGRNFVNNKWERVWIEVFIAYLKVLFQYLIGGAEKCDENGQVVNIPA